jgi:hypothetical protein
VGYVLTKIFALFALILTLLILETNATNANLLCVTSLICAQMNFSASQLTKTRLAKSFAISVTSLKTTSSTQTTSVSVKKGFSMSTQSAKTFAVMDSSSKVSAMTTTHLMETAVRLLAGLRLNSFVKS